jgi:hypothetical protein
MDAGSNKPLVTLPLLDGTDRRDDRSEELYPELASYFSTQAARPIFQCINTVIDNPRLAAAPSRERQPPKGGL